MGYIIPQQVRAVDPWTEHRFLDNLNRRIRIFTQGLNCKVYYESFSLDFQNKKIIVKPGIAIVNDTMIHSLTPAEINVFTPQNYINNDGLNAEGKTFIHVFLYFEYLRWETPPKKAEFVLSKSIDIATKYSVQTKDYLWLGCFYVNVTSLTGEQIVVVKGPIYDTKVTFVIDENGNESILYGNPEPDADVYTVISPVVSPNAGFDEIDGGEIVCS